METGKKYLVSFSTTYKDVSDGYSDFELKQIRLIKSAKKFGIKNLKKWTRQSLKKTDFYKRNKELLDIFKGSGMWIWKPFIILEGLKQINDGDFLVYSDTSLYFDNEPDLLFKICAGNGGFFFIQMDSEWKLSMLGKRDIFHFTKLDNAKFHNAPLTEAYFMIFQRNVDTIAFVQEWLNMCLDEKLIKDDNFSGKTPLPLFKDHRGDMPLLALLRLQKNIPGFRNPAQWGNHLKLPAYRVKDEFIKFEHYWENEIYTNSPYGTILMYDKEGINCSRPFKDYFRPTFIFSKVKQKMNIND